jgi:hypothetical protein
MAAWRAFDMMSFKRIDPAALMRLLEGETPPVVLDARRRDAFVKLPHGVPGAIALVLDDHPVQLPDLARERPVVAYCL